jgi:VWFA-related protein
MTRPRLTLALLVALAAAPLAPAQTPAQTPVQTQTQPSGQPPTPSAQQSTVITANSTVVLVPALVTTKKGEPVFTLAAKDFTLTDDGISQPLTLEENNGDEPLALVVAVQTGGSGARQLAKYRTLALMVENIVGNVPHKIAIVTFDSTPKLAQDFSSENDPIDSTLNNLNPGDDGAAILDTLGFSVNLLKEQPTKYRRAILLISETLDRTGSGGSHIKLEDALREISDTNTAIYSLGFSPIRGEAGVRARHAFNNPTPGPRHGCMAKDTPPQTTDGSAPDTSGVNPDDNSDTAKAPGRTPGQTANQAYDCLGLLLPPLALAKMAVQAGMDGLKHNVPETVAELTGGEYFQFKDTKTLERDLETISNHVPNRYILTFHPQAPHPGLHAVSLRLNNYPNLDLEARNSYWVETDPANSAPGPAPSPAPMR